MDISLIPLSKSCWSLVSGFAVPEPFSTNVTLLPPATYQDFSQNTGLVGLKVLDTTLNVSCSPSPLHPSPGRAAARSLSALVVPHALAVRAAPFMPFLLGCHSTMFDALRLCACPRVEPITEPDDSYRIHGHGPLVSPPWTTAFLWQCTHCQWIDVPSSAEAFKRNMPPV